MSNEMDFVALSEIVGRSANIFAARHRLQPADRDDALQEAFMAALTVLPRVNPSKGSPVAFLRVCVDRQLKHWHHRRRMVRGGYGRRFLGVPAVVSLDAKIDVPDRRSGEEEAAISLRELIRLLPRLHVSDRVLLVRLLAGETLIEVASRLGVSRQRVSVRRQKLLARLRRLLPAQ